MDTARQAWLMEAPSEAIRQEWVGSDFLTYQNAAGEVADFHATRHTYITTVVRSVTSQKMAQTLARHSTPTLTARYTHLDLHDTAAAAAKLPAIVPPKTPPEQEGALATGTYGSSSKNNDLRQKSFPQPYQGQPTTGHFQAQAGTNVQYREAPEESPQVLTLQAQTVDTKADGEGFEPPEDLRPQQFSRLPP